MPDTTVHDDPPHDTDKSNLAPNAPRPAPVADKAPETKPDATAAEKAVQDRVDEAEAQGFIGVEVDPTPNEHYTVDGVTAGKPTPETDADAAKAAREATRGT